MQRKRWGEQGGGCGERPQGTISPCPLDAHRSSAWGRWGSSVFQPGPWTLGWLRSCIQDEWQVTRLLIFPQSSLAPFFKALFSRAVILKFEQISESPIGHWLLCSFPQFLIQQVLGRGLRTCILTKTQEEADPASKVPLLTITVFNPC